MTKKTFTFLITVAALQAFAPAGYSQDEVSADSAPTIAAEEVAQKVTLLTADKEEHTVLSLSALEELRGKGQEVSVHANADAFSNDFIQADAELELAFDDKMNAEEMNENRGAGVIDDEALDVVVANSQSAAVFGNSFNNTVSGNNIIDSSFNDLNGGTIVVQNTGAGAAINASLIVNYNNFQ